jgi:N-acetyltransferase
MSSRVKHTYGSRPIKTTHVIPLSFPRSTSTSSPSPNPHVDRDDSNQCTRPSPLPTLKRKRSLLDNLPLNEQELRKSASLSDRSLKAAPSFLLPRDIKPRGKALLRKGTKNPESSKSRQTKLTQLHFALETTTLHTCSICSLTYTRAAPDDESLHRAHCVRVQKGMEWGKEEEREAKNGKILVEEVRSGIKLKNGGKGRIICFRADVGGKVGNKVSSVLELLRVATLIRPCAAYYASGNREHHAFSTSSTFPNAPSLKSLFILIKFDFAVSGSSREDYWLCHCTTYFHSYGDSITGSVRITN